MAEKLNINSGLSTNPGSLSSDVVMNTPALGYDGINQFDYEDVIDRIEKQQVDSGLAFGVDEEFRRSVDAAAVAINPYAIGNMDNVNSPYPGRSTGAYNPYTQKQAPNLNSAEGIARFRAQGAANSMKRHPDPAPGYENPIEVGIRESNFERYYKNPQFGNLGWHPYANNEEYYNQNTTVWDDWSRMSGEWGGLFSTGFKSVYRSIGDIFEGGYVAPDLESAYEFEDAMRIGNSSREGGVFSMKFLNNLTLNSAYTFGIISSIALEEIVLAGATALSGGALAPAAGAKTALNVGKIGRHMIHGTTVGRTAKFSKDMLNALRNTDKARDFFTVSKGGNMVGNLFVPEMMYAAKSIKTARQAGKNLSNIAKVNKYFGGFYRDIRAVNLAAAESKMEAGMVYNKMLDDEYRKYKKDNEGSTPPLKGAEGEITMESIHDYANKASFAAGMWNFPLIYLTNKLVLDGALRGFKPMGRVLDETISGIGSRVLRNKRVLKDVFYDAGKNQVKRLYNRGIKGGARATGAGALRYLSANFAEGFQELGQEAIAVGTQDYYTGLLNDPTSGGLEAFNASVSSAVDSQMNSQGWETFMSGFLMGGLVQGPQKVTFQWIPEKFTQVFDNKTYQEKKVAKEDYVKQVVNNLNEAWNGFMADPSQYFDESKLNGISQKQLNQEMLSASFASDALAFMDAKDQSIFQHLYTISSTGKMFEFRDQIKGFMNMSDEELIEAFPEFGMNVKSGKTRERFSKMISRSETVEKNYNKLNDKYINPFDRGKFTSGTREYNTEAIKEVAFNHAKFMMMFTKNTFERAVERTNQIYTELSQDPIISKIAANEIALFTNLKNLKTEMEVLSEELKLEASSEKEKEIQEEKIKRLSLLQDYLDVLSDKNNITKNSVSLENPFGLYDRRKMGVLRKPFVALLNHFAEQKEDFVNKEDIDVTLKKILDYKFLKGRIQDYSKAIDTLIEPGRLDVLSERMGAVLQSVWENRKKDVENRIRKYVKTKEQNEFLNQLAKIGVYPTPEDAEMFLSDGVIPQNYMDEQGDITQTSDPNKYQQIQNLIIDYRKGDTDAEGGEASGESDFSDTDFSDLVGDAEGAPGVVDSSVSINTQKILSIKYNEYRAQGGKNTAEIWAREKDATNIRKARAAVENIWFDTSVIENNEFFESLDEEGNIKEEVIIEGKHEDNLFEDWFKDHHKDPDVYRAYNQHGNLKYSDLSLEGVESKQLSQDKLLRGEKIVAGDDRGYYVIKKITDDGEGNVISYYELVDNNNNNVYDKWKHVVKGLASRYSKLEEAMTHLSAIQNNLATKAKFQWVGLEFETGTLVEDKDGNVWEVISNSNTIKKFGNLAVVPFGSTKTKGSSNIKTLKPDEWKKNAWKFNKPDFSKVTRANEGKTKLQISEPIKFYPFKKKDEATTDSYERFYTFLTNLTQKEKNSLVLEVTKNEDYVQDQSIPAEKKEMLVYDERIVGGKYDGNPQIRKGSSEFSIKLVIKDNKELSKKFTNLFEKENITTTDIIGFFSGNNAVLLDRNLKVIDPLRITPQQTAEIFQFYGDPSKAAEQVRTNYASSFILTEKLREKLGNKDAVEVALSDLEDVEVNISPGQFNYDESKPQPFSDLDHNSVAEVDGEQIFWILDMRSVYSKKTGLRKKEDADIITNLNIDHPQYDKIDEAVDAAMKGNKSWTPKKYLGRYVGVSRLPNGTYTFVELKSSQISEEEGSQVIIDIKNRQSLTAKTPAEGGNVTMLDETDREAKVDTFNHIFNEEIASRIYIAGRPGELIDIEIESRSDIKIRYRNKNRVKNDSVFSTSYTISATQMEGIETLENFIELVNFIIETKDASKKSNEDRAGTYSETKKFAPLKIKTTDFRRSLPKRTDLDKILENTITTLQNPIRTKQRLEAVVTDSDQIQKYKNTTVVSEEPVVSVEEPVGDPQTEAWVGGLVEKYGEGIIPTQIVIGNITEEEADVLINQYGAEEATKIIEEKIASGSEGSWNIEEPTDENQQKIKEYNELDNAIQDYTANLMARIKAAEIADGKTLAQANASALRAVRGDDTLLIMKKNLEAKKNDIGYKILRTFDGNDVEDINVFTDWANKNLPEFISIEDIEGLKERLSANGITVGAFVLQLKNLSGNMEIGGTIYTGATSPYRYHEAFHSVFRLLLTDAEINKYIGLAKKEARAKLREQGISFSQALDNLKKLHPQYGSLTQKQLEERYYEEYLADEFEKFKRNPSSTKTDPANKNLFQMIWEWIKSVFEKFTKNELLQLYENIDSGKFKGAARQSNAFTNAVQGGVTTTALKAIPVETVSVTRKDAITGKNKSILTNIYLPSDQQWKIVSTIGALYLSKERKWGTKPEEKNRPIPTKQLLNDSIDEYTAMYNPERPFYLNEDSGKDYLSIAPRLEKIHNALIKYQPDVREAVINYLELFNIQYAEERYNNETFEDDYGLRTVEEWDKDASMIGGVNSLSVAIRKFIATTTVSETDEFGNRVLDPEVAEDQQETLVQAVDYITVYNGILKAIAGTSDPMQMLQKMYYFGEGNKETSAVINRIFTEIGVTKDQIESGQLPELKNKLFFQSITNGLTQFRLDYIFVHTDLSGEVHLYSAANRDDSHAQLEVWSNEYDTKRQRILDDSNLKKQTVKMFNKISKSFANEDGTGGLKSLDNGELEKRSLNISNDLYEKTGIKLSPVYVAYSIARGFEKVTKRQAGLINAHEGIKPITWDDMTEMAGVIKRGEHLFLNIEGEGSSTRLRKLAVANGMLDENVGATVFLNPEGNFVYAHQMPTYHLEKVAELNSEDALDEMKKGDVFLQRNYLLNDPKFQALARDGKLKVLRISGSKKGDLSKDDETGSLSENNFLDINKKPGTTYGDSTPRQFILDLINIYTYNYNRENQKTDVTDYKNEDGVTDYFTTAPVLIRVIEASDTGDFLPLAVVKAAEYDEDGDLGPSKIAVDTAIKELETEYLRVKREANQEDGYTTDTYEGYNDSEQGRAYQLWYTGNYVTKRALPSVDRTIVKAPYFGSKNDTEARVITGNQKFIVRGGKAMKSIGLRTGNEAYVTIGKEKQATEFLIRSKGLTNINELDSKGVDAIYVGLNDAVVESDQGSTTDKKFKYKIKTGDKIQWTDTKAVADFLNGVTSKYIYELIPKDAATEVGFVKIEKNAKEEITPEEEVVETPIEGEQQTTESVAVLYDKNTAIKESLEKSANRGRTFNEALEDLDLTLDELKELVSERMMTEFKEFEIVLGEIRAYPQLSPTITEGLKSSKGKVTEQTELAMKLYNLKQGDTDHNLAQFFFNDWINTKSLNQVLLGDQAMTLKDSIDQIKRAKMQNAAGPTAASIIAAPEYGIEHPNKHISLLTFEDPTFVQKHGVIADATELGKKADGQMYMTTKAFKYMWFGLGKLSVKQVELLDKVERGESISAEEFFGNADQSTKGFKDLNAVLNSKKFVYGDGKTYLKMSGVVLTKELTSELNDKDEWVALPHRTDLHNLRVKMEAWEDERVLDENGNETETRVRDTIAVAAPASAVKMLKRNLTTAAEALSNNPINAKNVTGLDANYMRLQMINPSNKIEITDPVQIKSLITSEQKDSETVWIGNKEMTVGEIREAYHKSVGDRITLQYKGRRNLVFDLPGAMDELHKSISLGQISVNLRSFLRYALVNLEASHVKTQMLEFFSTDLTGEPKYDLNFSPVVQKFQELFLSYFSKGIMREKIPGHSLALMSDQGMKVIKKVVAIDKETGQPSRWDIVRTDQWVNLKNKPKLAKTDYDNSESKEFVGLSVGDYYVDSLRANVKEYNAKGEETGQTHFEFMAPPHFKEVMQNIMMTKNDAYIAKEDIFRQWYAWTTTAQWSERAKKNIIRTEIPNYSAVRSMIEFAAWKGYTFNELTEEFENQGNEKTIQIPDVVAKMFGIRIPSQDKHSAINLKLVDFMPVYYGSTAVFPEELIEISGADFDIDKLYAQIKEFYNVGKDFFEYGKAKTEDGQYADYVRYMANQAGKKGNVVSDALEAWNENVPGNLGDETGIISNYLTKEKIEELIGSEPEVGDPRYFRYLSDYNQLVLHSMLEFGKEADKTITKLWEGKKLKNLMGAMETLHLPITKKEYLAYKEKHGEPYVGALNNDVLDYKFALLGNRGMTEAQDGRRTGVAFEPADVTPLSEVWKYIQKELPKLAETAQIEGLDIDNPLGKVKAWTSNKEGARSIGAVVLPNMIINLLAENNIQVRSKKVNGKETLPQIRLNGHTYTNFNTKYEIDPNTGEQLKNGYRTQYVVSALVTGMTDNAKDQYAAKLGLNKNALAIATNLVALGVSLKTAVLLLNHPTIKEAYFLANNKDKPDDPGARKLIKDRMKDIMLTIGDDLAKVSVTDELLTKNIITGKALKSTSDYTSSELNEELAVLTTFLTAYRLAEYTGKVQSIVTLNSGMGRDTETIDARNENIENLGIELNDKEFSKFVAEDLIAPPIDVRKVFNEDQGAKTLQARYYTIYKEFTSQLLPSVFLTRTPDFVRIKDVVLKNMIKDKFYMTTYRQQQIEKDLLSYVSIKAYMRALSAQGNNGLKASLQNGFIYDQNNDDTLKLNTVVDRVKKYLDYNNKKNYFIDKYVFQDRANSEANNSGVNRLRANTWTRLSDSQVVNLQNSFLELYSDLNTREDAIHIVHYILVKDAIQYKAGTILDAIPPVMFDNILQQVKSVHKVFNLTTKTDEAFKRVMGTTLPGLYNEFVEGYLGAQNNHWLLEKVNISSTSTYDSKKFSSVSVKKYGATIRQTAQSDEQSLYVYGDNASETGMIGQQLLRGIRNTKPFPYKLNVGFSKNDYYSDDQYSENIEIIDESITAIQTEAEEQGYEIIFPDNLLANTVKGTQAEVARMNKHMPKTYSYIKDRLKAEFGYDISKGNAKRMKKNTEALGHAVHINEDKKTLVVDLYKGVSTFVDKTTGVRKTSRWSGKKTKSGKKIPAWKVASSKFEDLKKNMSFIMKKGFTESDIEIIENKKVLRIGFPYMVRVDKGTFQREDWKFYKLETVWGNTDPKTSDFSTMIEDGDLMAYGNRAEYKEVDLSGSYGQNPIGFVFGDRPLWKDVEASIESKNDGIMGLVEGLTVDNENYMDNLIGGFEQDVVEKSIANAKNVDYDGKKITITTDSNKKLSIQDLANRSQQVEDAGVIDEKSNIETTDIEKTEQDDFSGIGEFEIEGRGQIVDIENLKSRIQSSEPMHSKINAFWAGLSRADRAKLRNALEVDTVAGLIDEFNAESNTFTEDEFIEDLKKCYL